MTLTRDEILARRAALPRETVEIPDLGGAVTIRVLTLKEVGEIMREQKAQTDPTKLYPKLVALGCCTPDGSPMFVGEDLKIIEDLPWAAVNDIAKAVIRINKLGDDAPKDSTP